MDITNIFCQSLGVTFHAKTFLTVCRFRTDLVSVLTAWGIRSKKIVIRLNEKFCSLPAACRLFSRGVIFTRARVSLALLSPDEKWGTTRSLFRRQALVRTSCYSPGHVRYEFYLSSYYERIIYEQLRISAPLQISWLSNYQSITDSIDIRFSQYLSFFQQVSRK